MVYILLADGFEEIEALAVADILRRASVDAQLVSVSGKDTVCGAHNITVGADVAISDVKSDFDMVILPGGYPGYVNLQKSAEVKKIVEFAVENSKYVAAICAAPSVLGGWGVLKNKKAVCYPSFEDKLTGAKVGYDDVACDGNIITSRGAGTAHKFAFKIVELLKDAETADKIKSAMIYQL